jgi:hypothetical protein
MYLELVEWKLLTGYKRRRELSNKTYSQTDPSQPTRYQIRIKGQLDSQWTDWFEGLTITLEDNGDTLLTGHVIDQAALHGLLKKVRDLGMPLISVCTVEPGQEGTSKGKPSTQIQ